MFGRTLSGKEADLFAFTLLLYSSWNGWIDLLLFLHVGVDWDWD